MPRARQRRITSGEEREREVRQAEAEPEREEECQSSATDCRAPRRGAGQRRSGRCTAQRMTPIVSHDERADGALASRLGALHGHRHAER
jgi:hypothetical protein